MGTGPDGDRSKVDILEKIVLNMVNYFKMSIRETSPIGQRKEKLWEKNLLFVL